MHTGACFMSCSSLLVATLRLHAAEHDCPVWRLGGALQARLCALMAAGHGPFFAASLCEHTCSRTHMHSGGGLTCAKGGHCMTCSYQVNGRTAAAVPRGAAIGWFVFDGRPLLYATYLLALALVYVYCVASTAVYRRVREIPRARLVWDVLCIILGAGTRPLVAKGLACRGTSGVHVCAGVLTAFCFCLHWLPSCHHCC